MIYFFFFFQAEDGIRDADVTGVQTCALPISEVRAVEHGAPTSTGLSNAKLGMWAFLGSECLLFGALISTFLLYRGKQVTGPTPQKIYDIPYTSVSSFVLLMSSLTMVLALAAIQRGDHGKL